MTPSSVPHLRIVVAICFIAIGGYGVMSAWVLQSKDAALIGDVIGTWKSFAVLAVGFWIGASSGGKTQAADQSKQLGDLAEGVRDLAKSVPNTAEPQPVVVTNDDANAIPVEAKP